MTDFDHIKNLFDIIEGCVAHTGKFAHIQTMAFAELQEINEHAKEALMQQQADANERAEHEAASRPKAIPSEQFDLSGKPKEDAIDTGTQTTLVDRR